LRQIHTAPHNSNPVSLHADSDQQDFATFLYLENIDKVFLKLHDGAARCVQERPMAWRNAPSFKPDEIVLHSSSCYC
jgi:hypothetical protein